MHHRTHSRTEQTSLAGGVSMAVLAVGLLVTAADVPMAWLVWPVGYGVVLPVALGYAKQCSVEPTDESDADELAKIKGRYVDGAIDEAEFETELEAALSEEESP